LRLRQQGKNDKANIFQVCYAAIQRPLYHRIGLKMFFRQLTVFCDHLEKS